MKPDSQSARTGMKHGGRSAGACLTVIIPVFNEAATIVQILERVLRQPEVAEVIVVDDGSIDGTPRLLRQAVFATEPRVRILTRDRNQGKGAAIIAALPFITSPVAVIQDADLEYDPADYRRLLRLILSREADVVYGSRFAQRRAATGQAWHVWGNRLLTLAARWITGLHISDEATCYKMARREIWESLQLREKGFGFCPEFTAKISRSRVRIREVPIAYHPRTRAEGKKIRLWHGVQALVCLVKYRFVAIPQFALTRQNLGGPACGAPRCDGLTLIELMVTVGIIGLLFALLLPALARGKNAAKRTQCLNNHRQIVLAWHHYVGNHDDQLPWTVDNGDGVLGFTNWVSGNVARSEERWNELLLVDPRASLLAAYLETSRIYKCPADPSDAVRSVSMNNRLNPVRLVGSPLCLGGHGTNFSVYRCLSDIRDTSRVFVTVDERFDSINEGNFAVDLSNTGSYSGEGLRRPYWWVDTPAAYHDQGAVFSFADGHVEWHRWIESTTLGPIGQTGPRRTTENDRDISWLQFRSAESIR